jgi:hypothetical protein
MRLLWVDQHNDDTLVAAVEHHPDTYICYRRDRDGRWWQHTHPVGARAFNDWWAHRMAHPTPVDDPDMAGWLDIETTILLEHRRRPR